MIALRYRCPKCGAEPTQPCVRLTEGAVPYHRRPGGLYGPTVPAGVVGEPTRRPHNERMRRARDAARVRAQVADRKARLQADPYAEERAAYAEEVKRETLALTRWLRAHGAVLWSTPVPVVAHGASDDLERCLCGSAWPHPINDLLGDVLRAEREETS